MHWQDYKQKNHYKSLSVGLLDGTFVLERKIQSGMISDFYKISKQEYEGFMDWCEDDTKILEIRLREVWVRGFFGFSEFRIMKE